MLKMLIHGKNIIIFLEAIEADKGVYNNAGLYDYLGL